MDFKEFKYKDKRAVVKNPYRYAWNPFLDFLRQYLDGPKAVLFLGLNPSQTGMGTNGIPFGDIVFVQDWLKITGKVSDPTTDKEIDVEELSRSVREDCGKKIWGLIEDLTEKPANFFSNCFVHNYCALLFTQGNANVPPNKCRGRCKIELVEVCDKYLIETLKLLKTRYVIAMGKYTQKRAKKAKSEIIAAQQTTKSNLVGSLMLRATSSHQLARPPQSRTEPQTKPSPNLRIVRMTHPASRRGGKLSVKKWKNIVLGELDSDDYFPSCGYFEHWHQILSDNGIPCTKCNC